MGGALTGCACGWSLVAAATELAPSCLSHGSRTEMSLRLGYECFRLGCLPGPSVLLSKNSCITSRFSASANNVSREQSLLLAQATSWSWFLPGV